MSERIREQIERRAARLREIAKAIADGNDAELTMRVPAETERDADLVCGAAADSLTALLEVYEAAKVLEAAYERGEFDGDALFAAIAKVEAL